MTNGKIKSEIILVTPPLATTWLEGNTHNRPMRDSKVSLYAQDMKHGRWRLTHEAIAFDPAGVLIDGQHRLWAVIEANVAVEFLVVRGFDLETQRFIGDAAPRSVVDVLKLADPDSGVSAYRVAAARRMSIGVRTQVHMTRQELIEFMAKHDKALDFAINDALTNKRVMRATPASVAAALGRAYYEEDLDRLREFGAIMLGALPKNEDDVAAHILRSWLMAGAPEYGVRVSKDLLIYMKVQRAIMAFIGREHIKSIYAMKDEAWALTGERPRRARTRKK